MPVLIKCLLAVARPSSSPDSAEDEAWVSLKIVSHDEAARQLNHNAIFGSHLAAQSNMGM